MNVCIFYYDEFAEFEVVLAALQFKDHNIFTAAMEQREYRSEEHQRFLPDYTIDQLQASDIDLFIIPGGDPEPLFSEQRLGEFLKKLHSVGNYLAAICGGSSLLAHFGLLAGKRCTGSGNGLHPEYPHYPLFAEAEITNNDVEIDGTIITAVGGAFTDFATELGRVFGLYSNDEEYQADLKWVKNLK